MIHVLPTPSTVLVAYDVVGVAIAVYIAGEGFNETWDQGVIIT